MSVRIIRIPIIPLGVVNAYLIQSGQDCILIDSGTPNSQDKIGKVLSKNNLSFSNIKLIIITHAHNDHAGSAAKVRDQSHAPILAHALDMDYYRRIKPMQFCPTGLFGKLFLKTSIPLEPFEAFEPDIIMSEEQDTIDLSPYGFKGTVRHTGGHTPGHIAVELESKDAFVGDLVVSGILLGVIIFTNRTIRPPFEDDPKKVIRELESLVQRGNQQFYLGHGGPLKANAVSKYAKKLFKSTRQVASSDSSSQLLTR